jgi:hypothetical protein
VHGFAAKHDDHACEASQGDRDLRGDPKSFARFHGQGFMDVLAGSAK